MTEAERRRRNSVIGTAIGAAVLFALAYAVGVPPVQSLLLAVVVVIIAAFFILTPLGADPLWPERDSAARDGARLEVARLSWAMIGQDNRVTEASLRRLQQIAMRRLALRGIDGADPDQAGAARTLLGELNYQILIAGAGQPPRYDIFVRCVRELENLDLKNRSEGVVRS